MPPRTPQSAPYDTQWHFVCIKLVVRMWGIVQPILTTSLKILQSGAGLPAQVAVSARPQRLALALLISRSVFACLDVMVLTNFYGVFISAHVSDSHIITTTVRLFFLVNGVGFLTIRERGW